MIHIKHNINTGINSSDIKHIVVCIHGNNIDLWYMDHTYSLILPRDIGKWHIKYKTIDE